jgi:nicotinamidase/pyrazinamidase
MKKRQDNVRYLISMVALLGAVSLGALYCSWPATSSSNKVHDLVIHCIPEAIVALLAVPIVYWFFERRGIMAGGHERRSEAISKNNAMTVIPEEIENASREAKEIEAAAADPKAAGKDLLVVVDLQEDFISGSLKAHEASLIVNPLNSAIRMAEAKGMIIVFTRDWHPPDHCSFKENGGPWATHCVRDTPGAQLVETLYVPLGSIIIDFGVEPGKLGYSPLENRAFEALLESSSIQRVYIAGIALEYCVQSTCVGAIGKGKRVVALESLIATAGDNTDNAEKVWTGLLKIGVEREKRHTALGES